MPLTEGACADAGPRRPHVQKRALGQPPVAMEPHVGLGDLGEGTRGDEYGATAQVVRGLPAEPKRDPAGPTTWDTVLPNDCIPRTRSSSPL